MSSAASWLIPRSCVNVPTRGPCLCPRPWSVPQMCSSVRQHNGSCEFGACLRGSLVTPNHSQRVEPKCPLLYKQGREEHGLVQSRTILPPVSEEGFVASSRTACAFGPGVTVSVETFRPPSDDLLNT